MLNRWYIKDKPYNEHQPLNQ